MIDPAADITAADAFPLRNDGVTIARAACSVCGGAFHPTGRRRYCSDACRQAAWRARHSGPKEQPPPPSDVPRSRIVYECPSCGSRYLGMQRCPDCQLFCRRVGMGGRCPHCEEPVAVTDLASNQEG